MTRYVLLLLVLGACTRDNPYYMKTDAGGDGGGGDSQNACPATACTGGKLCDTTTGMCMTCLSDNSGCSATSTMPVCDTDSDSCRRCVAHDECQASEACLPTGACGTDSDVAYVSAQGDDTKPCTHAEPCKTLTFAATKGKPYVKLQTNITEAVTLTSGTFTVLAAPTTTISPTGTTAVVTVSGTAHVTFEDAIINNGAGSSGNGILVVAGSTAVEVTLRRAKVINNNGIGLAIGDGRLTLVQTLISKNQLGGVSVSGKFDVTNSIITNNGGVNATFGGAKLDPSDATSKFEFNTVADNITSMGAAGYASRGINCVNPFSIKNTLVIGNPVGASCTFGYSMFDTGSPGGTNKTGAANFKTMDPAQVLSGDYYRIDTNSEAIDSADPTATIATDIDGDPRPQGSAPDIGADESL